MPKRYILTTQLYIVTILNSHQIFMTLNSMLHVIGFSNQLISEDNSRWLEGSNSWTYKTYTAVAVVFFIGVYTNVSRHMEPP